MYSTCIFCHAALGRNEALEHFPVGRRLAYDADKGRLWVVCRRCERWNLTPQEERWEAIDEAERLFERTRLRASTDNIGLARVADGTELVRIGAPLRPEFAAWRYGDQFGRRRRRYWLLAGGAAAVVAGGVAGGAALGIVSVGGLWQAVNAARLITSARQTRRRIVLGDVGVHRNVRISVVDAGRARLSADAREGFALRIGGEESGARRYGGLLPSEITVSGERALRVAAQLLPFVNRGGGSRESVRAAVDLVDEAGGSSALFTQVARSGSRHIARWHALSLPPGALLTLSPAARLALEMATHEEQERRAMEGELAELERAWRDAEEIAAIADDLLLPTAVGERLGQLKARSTARAGAASSPSSESGSATSS